MARAQHTVSQSFKIANQIRDLLPFVCFISSSGNKYHSLYNTNDSCFSIVTYGIKFVKPKDRTYLHIFVFKQSVHLSNSKMLHFNISFFKPIKIHKD